MLQRDDRTAEGGGGFVRTLLCLLSEQLAMLREYQESPEPEGATTLRYCGAERCLYVAAACCLDIGKHLIGQLSLGKQTSSRSLGSVLRSAGVVSEDSVSLMPELAHIRRRLMLGEWLPAGDLCAVVARVTPRCEAFGQEVEQFLDRRK